MFRIQSLEGMPMHADADDAWAAWLSRMILTAGKFGIPAPVSRIMSVHIQNDQGATHALTRRVFTRTEDAATHLKESCMIGAESEAID